jgi:hypothetical protein
MSESFQQFLTDFVKNKLIDVPRIEQSLRKMRF